MGADIELRDGCVLAVALCDLILNQQLWPDLDADSLDEFRQSVQAARERCLRAVERFDDESEV